MYNILGTLKNNHFSNLSNDYFPQKKEKEKVKI